MGTARTRASNKYASKAYDRIALQVHKGHKAEIQAAAKSQGKSLNAFINDAIDKAMEPLREIWDKPDLILQRGDQTLEFKIIDPKK